MSTITFFEGTHPPVKLEPDSNLSEHLTSLNSPVLFGCRTGICGTCLIEVQADADGIEPPGEKELELLSVYAPENPKARLACQLRFHSDLTIRYLGNN